MVTIVTAGADLPAPERAAQPTASPDGSSDPKVGVDFIDIIFGIAAGEVFIGLSNATRHELPRWGHLGVALAVITFSWVGYHKAKTASPKDLKFTNLSILQFLVDIAIVGSYFALVRSAETITATHVTLVTEAALLAAIFGLYSVWDILDNALGNASAPFDLTFTLDSAWQHVRGKGGLWKGRTHMRLSKGQ